MTVETITTNTTINLTNFDTPEELQNFIDDAENFIKDALKTGELEVYTTDDELIPASIIRTKNAETWIAYDEALQEHGEAFQDFVAYNYSIVQDINDVITSFEDAYRGTYDSVEDWAEELVSECYDLPEIALQYFDYAAFARDCECGGDIFTVDAQNGQVHVFDN
jgi:antirestriction protein